MEELKETPLVQLPFDSSPKKDLSHPPVSTPQSSSTILAVTPKSTKTPEDNDDSDDDAILSDDDSFGGGFLDYDFFEKDDANECAKDFPLMSRLEIPSIFYPVGEKVVGDFNIAKVTWSNIL